MATEFQLVYDMRGGELPWTVLFVDHEKKQMVAVAHAATMEDAIKGAALELNKEIYLQVALIPYRKVVIGKDPL